jgi:hypothetical protein
MTEETSAQRWRRKNPEAALRQSREGMQRHRARKRHLRDLAELNEITEEVEADGSDD